MQHYPINFFFKQHHWKAQVHKFPTHYNVWLTDTTLIQDYGGMITLDENLKFVSGKETKAIDAKEFYKAIAEHIL